MHQMLGVSNLSLNIASL